MSCNPHILAGYYLGCIDQCRVIATKLIAEQTGIHTIEYTYKGNKTKWEFMATQGQNLIFDNCFNECGETYFKIKQPNGCYFQQDGEYTFILNVTPTFTKRRKQIQKRYKTCQKTK